MHFNEKFIEKNSAELAKIYDSIHAININIQRISSSLIDGLKPVQRRAIYCMYLKDGGKTFKKLATISGDTFGKVHPHCLHGDTEFLTTDGKHYSLKEMYDNEMDNVEIYVRKADKLIDDSLYKGIITNVAITKYVYEYYAVILENGHSIKCTNDHEFLTVTPNGNKWVQADELTTDSKLAGGYADDEIEVNNQTIDIAEIRVIESDEEIPMYDYTVDDYGCGSVYIGNYHNPFSANFIIVKNSPTAIEDSIVNMAQSWHNIIPLIEPEGNFGSISGARAGASRYIKARLSEYCLACFFEDWKDSVVDMKLAYDEETMMPEYLPAKYPNVLLNGCLGIGFGMSSNIPCYNFREVVEATIRLMNNPKAHIVLIPDSPTGADIIEEDFATMCNKGVGGYSQRCTYEINAEDNMIIITTLPDLSYAKVIREEIANIKEKGGLPELINMDDLSGKDIKIELTIRDDVNPYKFMRKLIKDVPGFERRYPVRITVNNDYKSYDLSIKELLLKWIEWRRNQKRVVISNKRTTLTSELRVTDVKIFITNPNNLNDTIKIFRTSQNREEIERRLIDKYKNSEIRMDSLQARALSNMRMIELTIGQHNEWIKRSEELKKELEKVEEILNTENGIDKIIIAELRDGIKRFGKPRRSNVVPKHISVENEVQGTCIIQLSSDGTVLRKLATNAEEEPIPTDSNGFACVVDNDSSFIIIDNTGNHTFIKVKELPVDSEVPVYRYTKKSLDGNIIAMLPVDLDHDLCCVLISKKGVIKKIKINEIGPSKKPCISLDKDDKLVRGIVIKAKSNKDLLIYTKEGMGQRLDPNLIRITSAKAKGGNGFKLSKDDEIIGCYSINPLANQYLLYVTMNGRMRLNLINYLPTRTSKHDRMVQLISLNSRDKLISVVGCNKYDKIQVFYDDNDSEIINIDNLEESTMSSMPKKVTKKNATSNNIIKVKLI